MSMYGDSEKENLFYTIMDFLNNHSIAELLQVIADVVERKQ